MKLHRKKLNPMIKFLTDIQKGRITMSKQVISATGAPAAIGPYSQAILSGNTLFASGQIAPAEDGVVAQAEKAFDSIEAILKEAGFEMSDVVKTTVYLTDMDNFAAVNEVYGRRMAQPYPARSCVAVAALPKGALVEVEILAQK